MSQNQLQIRNQSFSAIHGGDRTVERTLFSDYSVLTLIPAAVRGERQVLSSIEMHGFAEVIIATALELAAVTDIKGPLPYPVTIPLNVANWPKSTPSGTIADSLQFAHILLETLFGIKPQAFSATTVIVVDPHLLPQNRMAQLVAGIGDRPTIVFVPEAQVLPMAFMPLIAHGQALVLRTNCRNPLITQGMEEIFATGYTMHTQVLGAGKRLLPTIVGVADTSLHYVNHDGFLKYSQRATLAGQLVTYHPQFGEFGRLITKPADMLAAVAEYLISLGFDATTAFAGQSVAAQHESLKIKRVMRTV